MKISVLLKKASYLTLVSLTLTGFLSAAPSGGPYGPILQHYEVPEVEGTVYYVSPDGEQNATGTQLDAPMTLDAAIQKVVSGDAIILRGGIYRTGNLHLNQSVIIQPYQDEQPVVKGTYLANEKDWKNVIPERFHNRFPFVWGIKWEYLFPSKPDSWWRRPMAGQFTPLHKFNNDMLFIDGRMLQSTDWFVGLNDDTFYIDYENQMVYLSQDPAGHEIEITAFEEGLVLTHHEVNGKKADHKGPIIRGIHFEQYAQHILDIEGYYPEKISAESEHGKDIVGTTIEHCTFKYAGRVGVDALGDKLTFRHCKISDTSTEGLYIVAAADVLLERNIFTRNNVEEIHGYYPAAVKIFNQTRRVVCNDNLVIDLPHSNGIWYDVGNIDGIFTNNWIENVGSPSNRHSNDFVWPSRNGFFFEISSGAVLAGNVFVNNDHGVLVLNADDVHIFNNTFVNSHVVFARDSRGDGADHFGWHVTTGPAVDERDGHSFFNNVLISDRDYERSFVQVWQPKKMCNRLTTPSVKTLSHNAYVNLNENTGALVLLNQQLGNSCIHHLKTLDDLQNSLSGYGYGSVAKSAVYNQPFVNPRLGRYELKDAASQWVTPMNISEEMARAAKMDTVPAVIGAYTD